MKKNVRLIALALLLWQTGCSTPNSRVYFSQPENAKVSLFKPERTELMPVMLNLPQTDDPAKVELDEGGRPIRIALPDGTRLQGFLYVYKSNLDQAEKLVLMDFRLTPERIQNLLQGQAVTVIGRSSKGKPVYKITLGIEK